MGDGSRKKGDYEVWISPKTNYTACEMDELYWFTKERKTHEKGINCYTMTIVSRNPRQIVAFDVDISVKSKIIQQMVNSTKPFEEYYVDGCSVYKDVDYLGRLKQNFEDKSDTHIVEGTNADLRHYVAGLRRRSRCFFRKQETLKAVLYILINAYNKFGDWKNNYWERNTYGGRDFGFNHTRFI